jgi:hypothetical protein
VLCIVGNITRFGTLARSPKTEGKRARLDAISANALRIQPRPVDHSALVPTPHWMSFHVGRRARSGDVHHLHDVASRFLKIARPSAAPIHIPERTFGPQGHLERKRLGQDVSRVMAAVRRHGFVKISETGRCMIYMRRL